MVWGITWIKQETKSSEMVLQNQEQWSLHD